MPPVAELTYKRAIINLADAGRLGEGEDLNDALLDFFTRLGQSLIPRGGEPEAPVSYLGAQFFKQLRSAFVTSGEDGWKNVQNWAKRKAGGLFKPQYSAFAVPINEDLKDDKGQDAGNHWWLALVLNPPGGARAEPTAVMCLDSMQRRKKEFTTPLRTTLEGSLNRYTAEVTEMEQAGYLLIITFNARGDGSQGPIQRPEESRLLVDGYVCANPTLGLRINMPGGVDVAGRFEGTLTFALDGRSRASVFQLAFGDSGYTPIKMEFDPFQLTKLQKDVTRYLGGYLAKEWETNGPEKVQRFEKQSARALVADVHQQENLNDCGVFVLENALRSLSMKHDFLKHMAEASPAVLKTFPWPSQADVTTRKAKLKAIVARLFAAAAEKGTADVETLLKNDAELKSEVLMSLTDAREAELDQWAGQLQKELAARQVDKDTVTEELRKKEEAVTIRREEERRKKDEEKRRAEEERKERKHLPRREKSSSSSASRSRSEKPPPKKAVQAKRKQRKGSEDDDSRRQVSDCSSDSRQAKRRKAAPPKAPAKSAVRSSSNRKRKAPSSSRSSSRSDDVAARRKRR